VGFAVGCRGGLAVAGGFFGMSAAAVVVELFGFFPGMAFTGNTGEGKEGEEQGGSFHTGANLAAIPCHFNFHFSESGFL
jgi:hypothetical protein